MSQESFQTLWKRLLIYCPGLPLPLAQEFINTAYSRALGAWKWSQLRKDNEFTIPLTYSTGTVTVTNGSAIVTGSGTSWNSTMVNQQFYILIAPFYDVLSVDSSTQITLTRPFNGAGGAGQSYNIGVVYQEMPSDFLQLETIRDLQNNWLLHLWVGQDRLDIWDSKRSVTGTPWIASAASPRVPSTGSNISRIELWPRVLPGPRYYAYKYESKPLLLVNPTDQPIFPIRGDVLIHGALTECALWPGTLKAPNNFFDLNLSSKHEQTFQDGLTDSIREDNEFYQTQVKYVDDASFPWAPIDAAFWQQHALF